MADGPQLLDRRAAEILFSCITAAIGIATIQGAREMNVGWTSSGPEAGYFPFRVGIIILCASIVNLVQRGFLAPAAGDYVSRKDARAMAVFFFPLVGLAVISLWVGIYIGTALYLLLAVGIIGRASWIRTIAIAAISTVVLFVMFEFVFKLPLPKGPLGPLFGML
jgi:hypothetical protein